MRRASRRAARTPLAAVFDVDETMILNLGEEWHESSSGKPYDNAVWDKWEKTGADKVAPRSRRRVRGQCPAPYGCDCDLQHQSSG